VVTVSRKELIADWRRRLLAAETAPVEESPRLAWLARVRIRLYRFLLSLYGGGDWHAAPPSNTDSDTTVTFDAPDVLPLAGKPAKGKDLIRSVLENVAGARDAPPERGPWIDGIPRDKWIVVVAASSGLDIQRCVQLFDHNRVLNRISETGSLVVPREMGDQARALVYANAKQLRRPRVLPPPRPLPAPSFWASFVVPYAMICAIGAFIVAHGKHPIMYAEDGIGEFVLYFTALFAAFMSVVCVRPIARFVLVAESIIERAFGMAHRRVFKKRN
jgi:hypothetical protein